MSPQACGLSSRFALTLLLVSCAVASGCSSLPATNNLSLVGKDQSAGISVEPSGVCTVEMRSAGRRAKTVEVPVTPDTRVQDVLQASKAFKRFHLPEVVLVRQIQKPNQPNLKLNCRYDRRDKKIGWESDYAVMPGDRIMVREDKSKGMGDMLGSVVGPFFSGGVKK